MHGVDKDRFKNDLAYRAGVKAGITSTIRGLKIDLGVINEEIQKATGKSDKDSVASAVTRSLVVRDIIRALQKQIREGAG